MKDSDADPRSENMSPSKQLPGNFEEDEAEILQNHIEAQDKVQALPQNGKDDKIICLIKTNEPHLRRAVERRSQYWAENRTKRSNTDIYDIKFEFQD